MGLCGSEVSRRSVDRIVQMIPVWHALRNEGRGFEFHARRAGTAVAFLRSHRACCAGLPRLRLRCSGNGLRDLGPAIMSTKDRTLYSMQTRVPSFIEI